MSYNKVIQVAVIRAKPAQGDRLAHMLSAIRDHANDKEPGCLEYRIARNQDEFVCYEVYQDQAALDIHMEGPHLRALHAEGEKGDLFAEKPNIIFGMKEI